MKQLSIFLFYALMSFFIGVGIATLLLQTVGCSKDHFLVASGDNCYDDTGDTNGDGEIDTLDCKGDSGQDGESIVGPSGPTGSSIKGDRGDSCLVSTTSAGSTITCTDGSTAYIPNGIDGSSCTVSRELDGAIIVCGSNTVFIKDGLKGDTGSQGEQGIQGTPGKDLKPVLVFDPCKRKTNAVDMSKPYFGMNEVLLKTADNQLIGANIQNTNGSGFPALSILPVDWGGYWATGGSDGLYSCTFQYRTITIKEETHRITWYPHTASTPTSFDQPNVSIVE